MKTFLSFGPSLGILVPCLVVLSAFPQQSAYMQQSTSSGSNSANNPKANFNSFTVTKLRASDGAILGAFNGGKLRDGSTLGNIFSPVGVAFDGKSIWVTSETDNTVTKLRAKDGAHLGTFPVGASPQGVAFDGSSIWVANKGDNSVTNGSVTKLRASDGANLGTFNVGDVPYGVAFDGSSMWVTNTAGFTVTKLRAKDGANLGTFNAGPNPFGLAFDGSSIW